ncbi:MAG: HAD family hydrolase [Reyranella sp.]|uniref:HAD family hydrolase n=1 Tax=Reyranella sp. TaxID=1929291 RepID=UPI00121F57C3|nr:HAD-IA family hydrolase [Reyranella sp.]TAJ90916.1 MAG: HAD family hydrolase [Reyranella sp.]TBR30014.1 MAG: HAD family hydrolase [Reyranella sp.]
MLVIFDCDGVLVDSEPLANTCFARALRREGLDWSVEETMRRLMGRSMKSCVEIVEGELGRALPADFVACLQADTLQAFRDAPLGVVPGVVEAIDAIEAAGIATCVASSGSLDKMRVTLGITGLWSRFEGRIFSSTQVPRGKPFPDLFLHSAIQMDQQPFDCMVVEDSLPGIQAARAAGMRALAYVGATYADAEALRAAGGRTFDAMSSLPMLAWAPRV